MTRNKSYIAEFNRCRGDNIRRCARRLERRGIPTSAIRHKTTLRMERPVGMGWPYFIRAVRDQLTPRIGSVLLHSQRTGNTFLCSNRGNRPGRFQSI
jgi:hypothetical protein